MSRCLVGKSDTPPYNNLALILASQGKLAEAISLYKKAVTINRDLWLTQTNLADTLLNQGQLDEAIAHYREAIRSNPEFVRAYYNLSYALSQKGQQAEANALKQKAQDLQKKTQTIPQN
jgi:protein O-GlcNAc transferase